jgi:hypothetical protein
MMNPECLDVFGFLIQCLHAATEAPRHGGKACDPKAREEAGWACWTFIQFPTFVGCRLNAQCSELALHFDEIFC